MIKKTLLVIALTFTLTTALAHSMDHSKMDHSKMDHGAMPMDHSQMMGMEGMSDVGMPAPGAGRQTKYRGIEKGRQIMGQADRHIKYT